MKTGHWDKLHIAHSNNPIGHQFVTHSSTVGLHYESPVAKNAIIIAAVIAGIDSPVITSWYSLWRSISCFLQNSRQSSSACAADYTSSGTVLSVLLLMLVMSAEGLQSVITGKQLRSFCRRCFISRLNILRWGDEADEVEVNTVIQSPTSKSSPFKSKSKSLAFKSKSKSKSSKIGLESDLSPSPRLDSYNSGMNIFAILTNLYVRIPK